MNRREFIRTAIATTTLMVIGATGMFELASKVAANQSSAQQQAQQVQLPPIASVTSQASTAQVSAGSSNSSASAQSSSVSSASSAPSASSASSQSTSTPSQASATSQSTSSSSQSSTASAPAGYVLVAQISSLSGKTSAYFNHPSHGNSILINLSGQWKAFSATCTHRPCTVNFQSSELYCPCHGATFSASNGSVTRGPAQATLGEYGVIEQNGGVYVSNSVIN